MDPLLTLQALGKPARYKAKQRIYIKGAQAREVFILNSGEALNILVSPDGHELVLQRVCPGDLVPMTGLLGDGIYQTDCIAQTNCEVTHMAASTLRKVLQSDPVLSFYVLEQALRRLKRRSQQLTDTAFLPVRARLSKWLVERLEEQGNGGNDAVLDLNGSERLIGLALGGVSRETVSRHLSVLVQAQVIARSGKKIIIRDVAKLRAMM
jgi:CRP-like cAMP-binding protein